MIRSVLAALFLVAAVSTPASAADVREPAARGETISETLYLGEAERVVKALLRRHIGPAVASNPKSPGVAVWGCRLDSTLRGACYGSVKAGVVKCRGEFRVREFTRRYFAWPLNLDCSAP